MKKFLAVVIALMMTAALAACGSSGSSSATTAAPAGDGGSAGGGSAETKTVAVGAVVIAADSVSEDAVYDFVSTIYDNVEAITEQHAKGAELSLEFATSVTAVPYHPGAAKYFEEKGFPVAAVKEGAGTGDATSLTFTTGSETGTYYGFGGVLGQYVSGNSDISVTVVSSTGSQNNIEEIDAGNAQLGFTQSDVMSYAYNGERLFDSKVESFSVVCALYMEAVQIVTTDPAITSVADLAGKTVSIGASGSGVYFNAVDVLGTYDLSEDDIDPIYQGFSDSAESLKDGKIDAAFIVAGAPTTAITDLATSKAIYLVGFDADHINALLAESPFYSEYTIPAGTY